MFFNEFPLLLENLATTAGPILLAGDFNFHVDNNLDCTATRFTQPLDAFNLKQNISLSTHKSCSTLHLILSPGLIRILHQILLYLILLYLIITVWVVR